MNFRLHSPCPLGIVHFGNSTTEIILESHTRVNTLNILVLFLAQGSPLEIGGDQTLLEPGIVFGPLVPESGDTV